VLPELAAELGRGLTLLAEAPVPPELATRAAELPPVSGFVELVDVRRLALVVLALLDEIADPAPAADAAGGRRLGPGQGRPIGAVTKEWKHACLDAWTEGHPPRARAGRGRERGR
jgi:hypothetical protein